MSTYSEKQVEKLLRLQRLICNMPDAKEPEGWRKVTVKIDQCLYKTAIELYDKFIWDLTGGPCKIDGSQGKAMKSIIMYLQTYSIQVKSEVLTKDLLKKYLEAIFNNWDRLPKFERGQIKLTQINSNLVNIINYLKNGSNPSQTNYDRIISGTGV